MAGSGEVGVRHWGVPNDAGGWLAFACAVLVILIVLRLGKGGFRQQLLRLRPVQFGALCAATALLLSAAYVHVYLGGGPRIIDATTYLLQARLLSHGAFAFVPEGPLTSYDGRFLIVTPDQHLAPLFPPGYPAVLALGVLLGRPLWIGPILGGLLALAVYRVGRHWFGQEMPARIAAVFSVISAAQRYHSADTMSHAWCALLFLLAVYNISRATVLHWCISGVCLGWLFATRPVTALAALACCGFVYRSNLGGLVQAVGRDRLRAACLLLSALPGLLLLLMQQRAVTGHWWASLQYLYYARSDLPLGCFRFGFGANVGCRFEHGEFVQQYMSHGYGLVQALATTGRRLLAHACDAANLELFSLALPVIAWWGRKQTAVRVLCIGLCLQLLAYVPFYFDGNYPGGGARLYADVLPFEHLLLGWGVTALGVEAPALALSLLGFATHAVWQHQRLAQRDGGRPMFESEVLVSASTSARKLLYVDTDHGFNLAYGADSAWGIARYRSDASDGLLYDALGRPESYRYEFSLSGQHAPRLLPYIPEPTSRIAGASLWPPSELEGGSAIPGNPVCNFQRPSLKIEPRSGAQARVRLALWAATSGDYLLTTLSRGGPPKVFDTKLGAELPGIEGVDGAEGGCKHVRVRMRGLTRGFVSIWLSVSQATELAYVELKPEVQ